MSEQKEIIIGSNGAGNNVQPNLSAPSQQQSQPEQQQQPLTEEEKNSAQELIPPVQVSEEVDKEKLREQLPKQTKFQKQFSDIIVKISEDKLNLIIEALKKDAFRLEFVSGGQNKVQNIPYVSLSVKTSKEVMKLLKKIKLLRLDIKGYGSDGGLTLEELRKKYPEIITEDVDEFDITDDDLLNETIGQYVIAKKAAMYFGIEDNSNYSLNDLAINIGLYESRNNFNPS